MSDGHLIHVEDLDPSAKRSTSGALDVLARALRGCEIPVRTLRAAGSQPSAAEGLALVQGFLAIEDPELRQALLDAIAALSGSIG